MCWAATDHQKELLLSSCSSLTFSVLLKSSTSKSCPARLIWGLSFIAGHKNIQAEVYNVEMALSEFLLIITIFSFAVWSSRWPEGVHPQGWPNGSRRRRQRSRAAHPQAGRTRLSALPPPGQRTSQRVWVQLEQGFRHQASGRAMLVTLWLVIEHFSLVLFELPWCHFVVSTQAAEDFFCIFNLFRLSQHCKPLISL